jgi:hypothetical protein
MLFQIRKIQAHHFLPPPAGGAIHTALNHDYFLQHVFYTGILFSALTHCLRNSVQYAGCEALTAVAVKRSAVLPYGI